MHMGLDDMVFVWLDAHPVTTPRRRMIRLSEIRRHNSKSIVRRKKTPQSASKYEHRTLAKKGWLEISQQNNVGTEHHGNGCAKEDRVVCQCVPRLTPSFSSPTTHMEGGSTVIGAVKHIQPDRSDPTKPTLFTTSYISNATIDPFSCTAVPLTREVLQVLEYYLQHTMTINHRAELLLVGQPVDQHHGYRAHCQSVRHALSDEMHMVGVLAGIAARMSLLPHNRAHHIQQADFFMLQAIRCARRHIETPDCARHRDYLILMHNLAAAEWFRLDFGAVLVHQAMMKPLLASMTDSTSTTKLDVRLSNLISNYDVYQAAESGCSPNLHLTWQPPRLCRTKRQWIRSRMDNITATSDGAIVKQKVSTTKFGFVTAEDLVQGDLSPFSSAIQAPPQTESYIYACPASFRQVGQGLQQYASIDGISKQFAALITTDIVPLLELRVLAFVGDPTCPEDAEWLSMTGTAILSQLLGLCQRAPEMSTQTKREQAAIVALIMLLCDAVSPMAARSIRANLRRWISVMEALDASAGSFEQVYCPSRVEGELTLWLLNVGLCAAAGSPDINTQWLVDRALQLALQLGINTWSDMHNLMARFNGSRPPRTCMYERSARHNLKSKA